MKTNTKYPMAALTVCLALTGCEPRQDQEPLAPQSQPLPETRLAQPNPATSRPTPTVSRDELLASVEAKLAKMDQQLTDLGAKAEALKDQAKAEGAQLVATLRDQRSQAGQKLEELKRASQDAWREAKAGLDAALADLDKALQNAKAKLSGD